jgi:hypothetical protein
MSNLPRIHRPWTNRQQEFLTANWERMDDRQMAVVLNRSYTAIQSRRYQLGFYRPRRQPTRFMRDILAEVCAEYGITPEEIKGPGRKRYHAVPRQEFMLRCHETGRSLPEIGRFLGRDHTTVLHGCRVARERREAAALAVAA